MAEDLLITYLSADGEERSERWPSIERFRAWALGQRLRCSWSAYAADDDGEWLLIDRGSLG